jgi:broad specificity phosphatase PhoE
MRVILLRHAQSENNIKKTTNLNDYDKIKENEPKISEHGESQVEQLTSFLKDNNVRFNKSIILIIQF